MSSRRWQQRRVPKIKKGERYDDFMKRYTKYKLETQKEFDLYKNKDGKYFCTECQSEVPFLKNCPGCNKKIDWAKVVLSD